MTQLAMVCPRIQSLLCWSVVGDVFVFSSYLSKIISNFIFRSTTETEEIKRKTSEAVKMLSTWKDTYIDVRAKIEASGRDQRWEFDRKRLFERTEYMSAICQNLHDIAQVRFSII